jgi:hypothetical protein
LVTVARKSLIVEATASGFLATLLQSWPILFFTNLRPYLVPYWLEGHPFKLFILQSLFIATYTSLCRLGAWLASHHFNLTKQSQKHERDSRMREILIGIIVSVIWQVLSSLWS